MAKPKKDIFSLVWNFRNSYKEYWPTPNVYDSIRFAFTEIAEVVDAELRGNETYRRNNERTQLIDDEYADCAIMIITALEDDHFIPDHSHSQFIYTDYVAWQLAVAMRQYNVMGPATAKAHLKFALASIVAMYGYSDLYDMMVVRLRRIFTKHVQPYLEE